MIIDKDTQTFAVGCWELDVNMARRFGYSETEIRNMAESMAAISRNYTAHYQQTTQVDITNNNA